MIASIFGKTKPINFVLLILLFSIYYWFSFFFISENTVNGEVILWFFVKVITVYLNLFLISFMIRKNHITANNHYAGLFFIIYLGLFPTTFLGNQWLIANVILLFSLRRILSIRSLLSIKTKLFDASFWLLVASLFNQWLLLFFVVVGLAIYFYQSSNTRNWLVPVSAVGAFSLLVFAWVGGPEINTFLHEQYPFDFSLEELRNPNISWLKLMVYTGITFVAIGINYRNLSKSVLGRLLSIRLILFAFFVGIAITILNMPKGVESALYSFFPAAILMSNALEEINKKSIKSSLLWLAIASPIIVEILL